MASDEINVSITLKNKTVRVGTLWSHYGKGRERASFQYCSEWLDYPERFALEPALTLTSGSFHTAAGSPLFGALGDSAPDRWGRVLMRRALARENFLNKARSRELIEIDYLLGVNDFARQGALRFSRADSPERYLAESDRAAVPPLIALPKLLAAADHFIAEHEDDLDLQLLLAPGSSLGGARPKASIMDHNRLAIAKFSHKDDDYDVVCWEAVALALAKSAKISVPDWRLETVGHRRVLISQRFDRSEGGRVPFLSAMSMLGAKDNESHSYLELVYAITQYGAHPEKDSEELWRRIVFSILISNTDDHLRNHGFLYTPKQGWSLSPAYDLNPVPLDIKPRVLTTSIDFEDTTASLELAMSTIEAFRLTENKARQIINEVKTAVQSWRDVAKHFGLSKKACDRMASAFELA